MLWQDWVFTVGNIIFAVALLPSVFGKNKPEVTTSLMTGVVLLIYSFTQFTLSLWFSSFTTLITACIWLLLAFQKKRNEQE
jgi:hypothetical protein